MAEKIKEQIEAGDYRKATNSWGDLENYIVSSSNNIVRRYPFSVLMSYSKFVYLFFFLKKEKEKVTELNQKSGISWNVL